MKHASDNDSYSDELGQDDSQDDAQKEVSTTSSKHSSWFGLFVRWTARGLLLLIVTGGGLVWFVYQSAQKAPEFYESALASTADDLERDGKEFESRLFELQNATQEPGPWQAVFTEKQVNGWLASDLPEKFPRAIPREIDRPRVHFAEDEVQLAFRFQSDRFSGIIVAKFDAFCAERPNEVVIRIKSATAGIAPLPISTWADEITKTLRRAGSQTSWTEIDGDPVAIVTLPRKFTEHDDVLFKLETVQMTKGKLHLSGESVSKNAARGIEVKEN